MQSSGDTGFNKFWSNYPKKVKKVLALKEWRKLKAISVEDILAGIERWKLSAQWQDVQFIPDPERFLKYRRWEDEVPINGRAVEHENPFRTARVKPEYLRQIEQLAKRKGM